MLYGWTALLASFGFGILFNIRGNKLFAAALIGGAGGLIYDLMLRLGYSEAWNLFVTSSCISLMSELCARFLKCPVTTFLICAIIPLVPGSGMYYTMLEVVQNRLDGAIVLGVDTIIQACSIAIGCILVSSMVQMIYQIKRKGIKRWQR